MTSIMFCVCCRCLRLERTGQLLIMLCLTLMVLNVMYILSGQKDVTGNEDQEAGCVTVTGLLHACVLSGNANNIPTLRTSLF